jgi:hypothetical protein
MPETIDELTPIANYMAHEMTHNPWTPPARRIRELNSVEESCISDWVKAPWWRQWVQMPPSDCVNLGVTAFFVACKIWYNQVKTDGPWDHKPILKRRSDLWSKSTGNNAWHIYGEAAYSFDCWSNMHYGYVGSALGFSAAVLLDGAGAAQAKSDWDQPNGWPQGTGPSTLPRRFDRPEDRVSISLGIKLRNEQPAHIDAQILVQAVVRTPGLLKQPASAIRNQQTSAAR